MVNFGQFKLCTDLEKNPRRIRLYIGMTKNMNLKVSILPPLNLIFSQAMLNIVVYQMLIVTNVPVNSAAL